MIPPQELKKKAFPKRMGGYEPLEVDEYIDFLIDKYTELFAQCDEYQTRLRAVATRIGEIQSEEEAIRTLAISTQKQCDNMLEEARADAEKIFHEAQRKAQAMISAGEKKEKSILLNAKQIAESTLLSISEKADAQIRNTQERADALLLSARTRCAKILNDFKKEINVQRSGLLQIKDVAENYNNILLNMYKEHLSSLASDMPKINIDLDALTESKLLEAIMQDIKNDAAHIADKNSDVEYDFQEELNILEKEIENIQNINDNSNFNLSKNDDADEKVQASDKNNTVTVTDTDIDNIERTTVFTKVPEAKFEEDVKVFAAQAAHNTSDSTGATVVFDKTSINNSADSNEQQEQYQEQYEEEPVAMTYDSDDFQDYEEDYQDDYDTTATVANSKEDRLRNEYDDYAALRSLSNNNDDDDDYPEESTKKGLFGLFGKKKNKKKNGKSKINDNYDDDEDSDDIDTEYDIDDDDDDYDIDMNDL